MSEQEATCWSTSNPTCNKINVSIHSILPPLKQKKEENVNEKIKRPALEFEIMTFWPIKDLLDNKKRKLHRRLHKKSKKASVRLKVKQNKTKKKNEWEREK